MARKLTDGEREILDELNRDLADLLADDDEPVDLGDLEFMRPPAAGPEVADPAEPPDLLDEAWECGYTAGRLAAEAELRNLALQVARLEMLVADYRAEIAGDR